MIKLVYFVGTLLLVVSLMFIFIDSSDELEIPSEEEVQVEKIPLYYNLDNPEKVYTREGEDFVEVKING